jgi:hypothetical protein
MDAMRRVSEYRVSRRQKIIAALKRGLSFPAICPSRPCNPWKKQTNPAKSLEKSGKIWKNLEKSGKIWKNLEKSGKNRKIHKNL